MKYVYDDLPTEDYFVERLNDLAKRSYSPSSDDEYEDICEKFFNLANQFMGIHYPECHFLNYEDFGGGISSVHFYEYCGTMAKYELFFHED